MSRELVESILNGDYVSANKLFEQKLSDIQEKKMYEMKKMVAAESNYSSHTQKGLESGKRLLTPAEREGLTVNKNVKSGGVQHPSGVKKRKSPPKSVTTPKKDSDTTAYKVGYGIGRTIGTTRKVAKGAWNVWSNTLKSGMGGPLEE